MNKGIKFFFVAVVSFMVIHNLLFVNLQASDFCLICTVIWKLATIWSADLKSLCSISGIGLRKYVFVFFLIFILCAVISMANSRLTFCSKIITLQFVSLVQNIVTCGSLNI